MIYTRRQWVILAATLIVGALLWVLPWYPIRYGLAFGFLWVLPGIAWTSLLPDGSLDRVERLAAGLGLSYVVTIVVTLLVSYLPGPVNRGVLIAAVAAAAGLPLVLARVMAAVAGRVGKRSRPVEPDREEGMLGGWVEGRRSLWRGGWAWLLVAVSVALALRVVNLGYSEFQGDEAVAVVRAAEALEGDETAIFLHRKGPAELALVMATWRLTGVIGEGMARLPFAWAGVLGVVAVFLWGRRLGFPHAGSIAACLLAVEGYLVGFGRIVQYQSLVFALSSLGLLCLLAYYTSGRGSLVVLGAALFAGGALAHYDAVLALPAGLFLLGARLWRDRSRIGRNLISVAAAGGLGALVLGVFYAPFLRSPFVGLTSFYVAGRVGGQFYNHWPSAFELSAVYDSIYFLLVLALGAAAYLAYTLGRWHWGGLVGALVLLGAVVAAAVWPERWVFGQISLAWVPLVLLLIGALLAPDQSLALRAVWLWLGVPVTFYLFLVAVPLTHIHTAFPAWAFLAGMGVARLGRWLKGRPGPVRWGAGLAGLLVYGLCGYYAIMMFVDHTPEYRRTFPQHRSPLYWTPYQEMPEEGLFGFPYRAGWKVVGRLVDQGVLSGTYDSNEEPEITDYYTRRAVRLGCASPDWYITADHVQDEVPIRWDQVEESYHLHAVATVGGTPKLRVSGRTRPDHPPVTYPVEESGWRFDVGTTPERVASSGLDEMALVRPADIVSREAVIGGFAHLLGYALDTTHATPGGYVEVTLVWEALGPAPIDYQVFTHLYDGQMRGQLDGQPVCDGLPTSRWSLGQLVVDPYRIPIRADAVEGEVPLLIGMYDLATMERLPVSTPDGDPLGDSFHLVDVSVRSP